MQVNNDNPPNPLRQPENLVGELLIPSQESSQNTSSINQPNELSDLEILRQQLHCDPRETKFGRIRDIGIAAHHPQRTNIQEFVTAFEDIYLRLRSKREIFLDLCEKVFTVYQDCNQKEDRDHSRDPNCNANPISFISALEHLVTYGNLDDMHCSAYKRGLDFCKQNQYSLVSFTNGFRELSKINLNAEQLNICEQKLQSYTKKNNCIENFINVVKAVISNNPSNEQLESTLDRYQQILGFCEQRGHNVSLSTGIFINLLKNKLKDEQFGLRLELYKKGLKFWDQYPAGDPFSAKLFTDGLSTLISLEKTLPSIISALRNLNKAFDQEIYYDRTTPSIFHRVRSFRFQQSFIDLLVIVYEELNRRGLDAEKNQLWTHLQQHVERGIFQDNQSYLDTADEVGKVYDFALDLFHGYEAFTQAARPIKDIDKPESPLLQRNLSHLAQNSWRLNCSSQKLLDLKFPGPAWHFEKFKIPQIQKDILSSQPLEYLEILGIKSADFTDLEASDATVMRGALILSNPEIKFITKFGNLEPYSIIIYNDHFDNPLNKAMLLVPTQYIEEQLAKSKVKLSDYKGYSKSLPDIAEAGLDAKTLLSNPNVFDVLTRDTLVAGFDFGRNRHENIYEGISRYKSIWAKLQLAMSLCDKGYVDSKKYDLTKIRAEFAEQFDYSEILLNEIYNWREWFLNTRNKDATPVLIDADPFRYSDEKQWSIRLDPSHADGIELKIKTDDWEETIILPDCPRDELDRAEWLNEIKTTWGTEVYSRVYNGPLTKALQFYNRKQIKENNDS